MTHEEAMVRAAEMSSDPEMQAEIAECMLSPLADPLDETDVVPAFMPLAVWLIIWHTTVARARMARKRLYIWRDRPTWVVRMVAQDYRPADSRDEIFQGHAILEMHTRRTNTARKAPHA